MTTTARTQRIVTGLFFRLSFVGQAWDIWISYTKGENHKKLALTKKAPLNRIPIK
jgi:hypothetical protein